jgi:hypothetical protein
MYDMLNKAVDKVRQMKTYHECDYTFRDEADIYQVSMRRQLDKLGRKMRCTYECIDLNGAYMKQIQ